jgi:hypothetical protein
MMVAIETMLVVMMMIMVMVLGTLTQVPFHHDLATLLLALSVPAPPMATIHKHPFPYFLSMPLPLYVHEGGELLTLVHVIDECCTAEYPIRIVSRATGIKTL